MTKTANPTSLPGAGGQVTFTIQVTNTFPVTVQIDSLMDNMFGDLTLLGDCASVLGPLPGTPSAPANTKSCSFTETVTLPHANVATVNGTISGVTVSDNDDSTVVMAVPTLGRWGAIALLITLLGAGTFLASRRRRVGG